MSHTEFYRGVAAAAAAMAPGIAVDRSAAARAAAVHAAMEPLFADTPHAAARACRLGCDHCCHLPVGVTFGEALRLATAVAGHADLHAQVLDAAQRTGDVAWRALVGRACPLLADGACRVHHARPLACRALASRDAEACARVLRQPIVVPFDDVALWRGLGAADALAAAEPVPGHRELRSALGAILAAAPADRASAFARARPVGDDAAST